MDKTERDYAHEVGQRLRSVRKQQRYSLQAVEALSNQEFKASVLGAYERGERSISVPRLQRLAEFYHVNVDQLLPKDRGTREFANLPVRDRMAQVSPDPVRIDLISLESNPGLRPADPPESVKCSIDLTKLSELTGPDRDVLYRYLNMIQVVRQDFNGRRMTVRADDIKILGAVLGLTFNEMIAYLDQLGVRIPV